MIVFVLVYFVSLAPLSAVSQIFQECPETIRTFAVETA